MPIDQPPPPPVEVDLARVTVVGSALWLLALVVTVVLALVGTTGWTPVAVCATGLALGGLGYRWAARRR
ncbi:DUF2530 domain-containing protein [Cellulomonas sp. CW35]|uniref:DUF2530 domain-containing protein n=1 Tax=Cellulomonas uda TaxID=1714 RepID=A0A4Y3KE19_CELUD|nr:MULTISPECIES: DUF2530 domain-containing protein [Cellulomonas]ASR56434.1 DUF2530 domain-containing protein [Cellulomonas sp. PSBB021]NII67614.1 hypothetical protein [Cellulomonas uda]GEA82679.1 hypothetical protein CUD01_31230 [Cellulomonas uda]